MSESPQQDNRDPLAERDGIERGHKLANTITVNHLTSKVKANPSMDLSQFLLQQANAYPQLRNSLVRTTSQRSTSSTSSESGGENDVDKPSSETESRGLLLDGDVKIIHPLSDCVAALANPIGHGSGATSQGVDCSLVAGLNQAIRNGEMLWSLHDAVVLGIGASQVVKIGTSLDHDSITNLQYINTHAPDLPAPSCLGALTCGRRTYVFMSRADGVTLETIWPQLLSVHKVSIRRQLNSILCKLRANLPDPYQSGGDMPRIGSFVSGACKDMRRLLRESEGPVLSEAEFNDFLSSQPRRTKTPWIKMIRSFMGENHRMVMTHGDLHPRNIMVKWEASDEDKSEEEREVLVTSLIDWELGGWYPEYWEFVKALSTVSQRGSLADWYDYLPTEAIGQWPVEFSIDLLISRWLG